MRRAGIVHADLARALTALRHTDLFVVSDSGLPAPPEVQVIDLAICYGVPGFLPVLRAILDEVVVEAAWGSHEVVQANPTLHRDLQELPGFDLVDHEEFKVEVGRARFVVRTGEATPYANVLLRAGVPWL